MSIFHIQGTTNTKNRLALGSYVALCVRKGWNDLDKRPTLVSSICLRLPELIATLINIWIFAWSVKTQRIRTCGKMRLNEKLIYSFAYVWAFRYFSSHYLGGLIRWSVFPRLLYWSIHGWRCGLFMLPLWEQTDPKCCDAQTADYNGYDCWNLHEISDERTKAHGSVLKTLELWYLQHGRPKTDFFLFMSLRLTWRHQWETMVPYCLSCDCDWRSAVDHRDYKKSRTRCHVNCTVS